MIERFQFRLEKYTVGFRRIIQTKRVEFFKQSEDKVKKVTGKNSEYT